jgi:hypothetical protein
MSTDYKVALEAAIHRTHPNVEAVEFEDDGEHVLLLTPDPEKGKVWLRYKLSAEAQRVVLGEYPTIPEDGLLLELLPPQEAR